MEFEAGEHPQLQLIDKRARARAHSNLTLLGFNSSFSEHTMLLNI